MLQPTFLYLSTAEAAIALGVSRCRIHQFIREGRIHTTKLGPNHAIPAAEIQKIQAETRPNGRPKRKG